MSSPARRYREVVRLPWKSDWSGRESAVNAPPSVLRWAKRRGLVGDAPDFHRMSLKELRKKPTIA